MYYVHTPYISLLPSRTHLFTRQGFLKIEYFGILKAGSYVFFDADSESPHMTYGRGKNATLRSYRRKTAFRWSRDQCSANQEKRLHFSVGLGFGIGLGL